MLAPEEAIELGLEHEREECETQDLSFLSIPIVDRSVPADREQFLSAVRGIASLVQKGRSIGIHCRASIGRSSLLAAAIIIQLGFGVEDAFNVIEKARGCPVPDTPDQKKWIVENIGKDRRGPRG